MIALLLELRVVQVEAAVIVAAPGPGEVVVQRPGTW